MIGSGSVNNSRRVLERKGC